jgi:hypothetical protein
MPSNPHLGFSKEGFPVSLTALGGADLAAISRDITPADVVRAGSRSAARVAIPRHA